MFWSLAAVSANCILNMSASYYSFVEVHELTRSAQLEKLIGATLASDLVEKETNVVIAPKFEKITKTIADKIWASSVRKIPTLNNVIPEIINTLKKDHTKNKEDAMMDIYRKLMKGKVQVS